MQFLSFRSCVVAINNKDGEYVIALFDGLPPPLSNLDTCVALLRCSRATFEAMCAGSPNAGFDFE